MRSMNILIAEDDDQNQAMMKLILIRQGHNVESAWTGRSALEAVKTKHYDLIFMDVQMPEMDGLEATRQIRKWENNESHVPIVILTGSIPEKIQHEYKEAGADTFLLKPFDVKRITMLVEIFAEESETNFQAVSHHPDFESIASLPVLDMADSLLRFNYDQEFYLENLQEFIQSLPGRLEKLEQSLKAKNWHELSTYAHNLKGVASNFGAKQLSSLASRLNEFSDRHELSSTQATLIDIRKNIAELIRLANKTLSQKES